MKLRPVFLRYASAAFCCRGREPAALAAGLHDGPAPDQAVARWRYFVPGGRCSSFRRRACSARRGQALHSNGPARAERASWTTTSRPRACATRRRSTGLRVRRRCSGRSRRRRSTTAIGSSTASTAAGRGSLDGTPSPDDALVAWGVERLAACAARARRERERERGPARRERRATGGGARRRRRCCSCSRQAAHVPPTRRSCRRGRGAQRHARPRARRRRRRPPPGAAGVRHDGQVGARAARPCSAAHRAVRGAAAHTDGRSRGCSTARGDAARVGRDIVIFTFGLLPRSARTSRFPRLFLRFALSPSSPALASAPARPQDGPAASRRRGVVAKNTLWRGRARCRCCALPAARGRLGDAGQAARPPRAQPARPRADAARLGGLGGTPRAAGLAGASLVALRDPGGRAVLAVLVDLFGAR